MQPVRTTLTFKPQEMIVQPLTHQCVTSCSSLKAYANHSWRKYKSYLVCERVIHSVILSIFTSQIQRYVYSFPQKVYENLESLHCLLLQKDDH